MKEKIKYGIYGVLYMLMWTCSLAWSDTAAHLFFKEPNLPNFALLAVHVYAIWTGVAGMIINIHKLQVIRVLEWGEKKVKGKADDSKRED